MNIASGTPLEDPERRAIGVAAGDMDGDGEEEVICQNFSGGVFKNSVNLKKIFLTKGYTTLVLVEL